jgi:hypothetical protein
MSGLKVGVAFLSHDACIHFNKNGFLHSIEKLEAVLYKNFKMNFKGDIFW